MKNILLILITTLSTLSLFSQPSEQYLGGMGKGMALWGEGKALEASAMFERIAQAEKDNWLPSY